MKAALLLFAMIFATANSTMAEGFDLMPMNIHFFGCVTSGENIIAYGNNGSYLMTTDKGETWKQHSLHEYGEIRKMVNHNDTLWGIINSGIILQSLDNGISWKKQVFELDSGDRFINIVASDKSIYVRSLNNIYQFNKNFELINSFSDSTIKVRLKSIPYGSPDGVPEGYSKSFIYFLNEQLLVGIESKYDGFVTLSEDLITMKLIVLKGVLNHNNPDSYGLTKVLVYDNNPVYNIAGNLYYAEDNFTKWSFFYKDTLFLNGHDSLYYQRRQGDRSTYYVSNNELFLNFRKKNELGYSDLGIKKYEAEPVDTFKVFNNLFINDYHTMYFHTNIDKGKDGIKSVLYNNAKQCILEESIIVKAGLAKSLLQTPDNGITWELVSYLTGKPKAIINDSTYIFFNDFPYKVSGFLTNYNEINRTEDYGNTFLPTKEIKPGALKFGNSSIFYMGSDGKGFMSGSKDINMDEYNLAYTEDGGRSYKFLSSNIFWGGGQNAMTIGSNVINIDGQYLFVMSGTFMELYNKTYILDEDFGNIKRLTSDSFFFVHHILADNLQNYHRITTTMDKQDTTIRRFEVHETNDSGKTYTTILKMDTQLDITQIYEHNIDSLFFATKYPARLYMYDRQRNVLDTLYKSDEKDSVLVMYLGGKFYILGEKLFLENTDRMDLTQWQQAEWDYGTPSFESVIFKGNVALARLSDDKRPWNYYRIMPKNITGIEEVVRPEIKYNNNHFYASPPYPMPAHSYVKTKVSWDINSDLFEAIKGVYNVYGGLYEGTENITVSTLNNAEAEISWDCSSAPNGLYFIIVKHKGYADYIPIVVER